MNFLSYVAQDIIQKYGDDTAHIAVVFPNKRAALFLNQELMRLSDKPIWSPSYITISDLFRRHSTLQVADPIKVIAELHKSFVAVTGKAETLDQFYGWGQLLLADFDDIDKNDADASKVFANLRDLHEYDDISYLTDEQKQLLKRFFSNFHDQDSTLQKRFIELWSRLHDVYRHFKQSLYEQGLAYEGMLYNDVVKQPVLDFEYKKYLFVGFNMIQKVEQQLFQRLKQEGRAAFYWDFDNYYLNHHEAGVYIRKYLEMFPNELDNHDEHIYGQLSQPKQLTFISAPTENIQARYITEWLRQGSRIADGNKTAVVLCDENLLQSVIHCIPDEVEDLNVTTGYPLQLTPVASFVSQLLNLHYHGFAQRHKAFRLHDVNIILRHPYARYVSELSPTLLQELNANKVFYPSRKQLMRDDALTLLFGSLDTSEDDNLAVLNWLKSCVRTVAVNGVKEQDPLFQESVFRMYILLNRLSDLIADGGISIDKITLQRFIKQLISATSIPFHGEPAVGVQVMGVLETRNLDFDHLLILSCNEGNMPKGVNDSSFIPHAVRSAYELTTVDNKVAIYSYYFHRLLQRAKDVTILYNNSTEGMATGEMSRFMLQLMVELGQPISKLSLQAGQIPLHTDAQFVEKTAAVMKRLDSYDKISPSAIIKYMRCPLLFFYNYVADIKEPDDNDEDNIDNRIFGNIFHRAAQLMYEQLLPHDMITRDAIEQLQKQKDALDKVLTQAFNEELFNKPVGTMDPLQLNGLQLINREVIKTYLQQLLSIDKSLVPFRILGHELDVERVLTLSDGRRIKVYGRIDRLDEIGIGTAHHRLRVVDYKTGNRQSKEVRSLDELFVTKNIADKHTDYQFQAMTYALIEAENDCLHNPERLPVSPALLFIQHAGADDYDPVITIGGVAVSDMSGQHGDAFLQLLTQKLDEIFSQKNAFLPTEDSNNMCRYCPYRAFCGR